MQSPSSWWRDRVDSRTRLLVIDLIIRLFCVRTVALSPPKFLILRIRVSIHGWFRCCIGFLTIAGGYGRYEDVRRGVVGEASKTGGLARFQERRPILVLQDFKQVSQVKGMWDARPLMEAVRVASASPSSTLAACRLRESRRHRKQMMLPPPFSIVGSIH
jgi:hypothetical protein